jgi:hypothetical protein
LGCDDEDNELTGAENAADLIYEKITLINSFIKEKIDNEVSCFLYEEFLESFDSIENRSFNSVDLLDFIKNTIEEYRNDDVMKESLLSGVWIRVAFIFDPKDVELEVWVNEFLELSEQLDLFYCLYGHHSKFEDIVSQTYSSGDYDTGIIASDLEVYDNPISMYMKSEDQSDYFPQDSIFEQSNYRKK